MLEIKKIEEIAEKLSNVTLGIIGDFCVDIYWHADMTKSELSRETPHYPLPIVSERTYLGAGGNVASNIVALKPKKLLAMSLCGDDWRGMLMQDILLKSGIDSKYFIKTQGRFTNAYCKPMRKGISATEYEDPRLDFDNFSPVSAEIEEKIIENLSAMAKEVDVLCVADQFRYGIVTDKVRKEICRLAKEGLTVIADSRYNIAKYTNCIIKPNEVECWRAVYEDEGYIFATSEQFKEAAVKLANKNKATVFCTLGAKGSFVTDGENKEDIPAIKLTGALDICGAGDTSLSAFSCAAAVGENLSVAARFAGLASSVTVQKIGVTGTASIEEIISAVQNS